MGYRNGSLPIVAIVGKPNVGKSSLFNRLIKKRKAIVSDEPGVTRDIIYENVRAQGEDYTLADSAGFAEHGLDALLGPDARGILPFTRKLNKKLIEEASLVIFLCEIASVTADDYSIAEKIRKSGKPYLFVLNKVDNEELLERLPDFFVLGMGEPIPVSAAQGLNIEKLQTAIAEKIKKIGCIAKSPKTAADADIDVAIVGRPNVGKSSLLNLLSEYERALVTPFPGTTRDAIDEKITFGGYTIRLVDTAGFRKRKKIKENVEFYSLRRAEESVKNSTLSVLIVDAPGGITTQDKKTAGVVIREKKGLVIALNKWDIARENGMSEKDAIEKLFRHFPHVSFADVLPVSAKTGYNKTKLLKEIIKVYNNYKKSIATSELNRVMRKFIHHSVHIKYGYQKSTAPPVFEFFISGIEDRKIKNYQKFIINSLRKSFDFTGVPVDVKLRKSR